jgi:hypothetical protein
MDITLDGLIREVQATTDDTLGQLELASQRAAELADLGDSLLNHFVDRCRKSGKTWQEIGEHLGVTRQAVQKRFVFTGPVTFERFTDRARTATANARREAVAMQHNYVGTEHQLLGLFDTGGGISDGVLAELGLTHGGIQQGVLAMIGRGPTPVTGEPPFTPRAAKVLEESASAALELGHNYIGTEHVLLGVFRVPGGVAKKLLEEHGATQELVRAKVLEKLAGFKKQ